MMKGSSRQQLSPCYITRLYCIGSLSARPDLVFTLIIDFPCVKSLIVVRNCRWNLVCASPGF